MDNEQITVTNENFLHPNVKMSSAGRTFPGLKKSSSFQNLKAGSHAQSDKRITRTEHANRKLHNSSYNVNKIEALVSDVNLDMQNSHMDADQMQLNANRISVNSDLLSRVEREKKQYESRISDLTQLTESRKMEIEKLTFELRNCREEMQKAIKIASSAMQESNSLRKQLESAGFVPCIDQERRSIPSLPESPVASQNNNSTPGLYNQLRSSPLESLATTTHLAPSAITAAPTTYGLTMSSASSEWNDQDTSAATRSEICAPDDFLQGFYELGSYHRGEKTAISVANLEGQLLQMREDNYTTTEELQATMQELGDLQRGLDEAREENRTLAFERAILLESLCTQTTKLEHCRLQINQLKQLLLTSKAALDPATREAHFCELYTSIDQEKQALLAQNNDLAQSSDSLAQECRALSEKLALLQSKHETLEGQHEALLTAYKKLYTPDQRTLCGQEEEEMVPSPLGEAGLTETWLQKVESIKTEAVAEVRSDLETRVKSLQEEVENLHDQLDLARVEHEREATEWKLYERDLLKTVRVADGIKADTEEEMRGMAAENHTLREQIKRLTEENQRLKLPETGASTSSVPSSITAAAVAKTAPQSNLVTPSKSSATSMPLLHHYQRAYLGCGVQSSPLAAGQTVRSLIQSIESQVKAVQQQKMGVEPTSPNGHAASDSQTATFAKSPTLERNSTLPSRRSAGDGASTGTNSRSNSSSHLVDGAGAPGGPPQKPVLEAASKPRAPVTPARQQTVTRRNSSIHLNSPTTTKERLDACQERSQAKDGLLQKKSSLATISQTASPSKEASSCLAQAVSSLLSGAAAAVAKDSSSSIKEGSCGPAEPEATKQGAVTPAAAPTAPIADSVSMLFRADPLQELVKQTKAGSKRNALLKWCQSRVAAYNGVEVNNFSSSWNNGLALCALLHTYLPEKICWEDLVTQNGLPIDKRRCFEVAFAAAEGDGIPTTLHLEDMLTTERPDWNSVMAYVSSVYIHFEASQEQP